MNNTSEKVPSTCLYSQDEIVKSEIYRDAILPVILPISVLASFMTTFTNLIVICTIIKTTSLHSPSNFLILGMAISDFGVGAFAQPLYTVTLFYELYHDLRYYCKVYDIFYNVTWIMGSTSLLTLGTFTTDRFIAVYFHLRYAEIVTSRRVGIALSVIWVYSIGCWLIHIFVAEKVNVFHEAVVFVSIFMNIYFLIRINRCVHRHVVQIQAQQQAAQQTMNIQILRKSINPMYYMFGAFVFWTFPYIFSSAAANIVGHTFAVRITYKLSEFMFLLNSLANPIIYFWRIASLRMSSYDLLKGFGRHMLCCCS